MLKHCIFVLILTLSLFALDLSEQDKQDHVIVSAGLGSAGALVMPLFYDNPDEWDMFISGTVLSLSVGIAKEAWDGTRDSSGRLRGTADVEDVYADAIGAIVGAGLTALFFEPDALNFFSFSNDTLYYVYKF